jgi:hypothetical protein
VAVVHLARPKKFLFIKEYATEKGDINNTKQRIKIKSFKNF